MSDSDATEPATDDFESRFFEMDDLDNFTEEFSDSTNSSLRHGVLKTRKKVNRRRSFPQKPLKKPKKTTKKPFKDEEQIGPIRRPVRQRRAPAAFNDAASDDAYDDDEEEEMDYERQVALRCSSSSRTRTGYQHSQSSLWSLEEMGVSTGGLAPSAPPVISAEQRAERERKVILRRESAKHKAELEKQATVEKLLRINTEYTGVTGKSRRGRRSTMKADAGGSSGGEEEEGEGDDGEKVVPKCNTLYPSATLDPPVGYVRLISSSRLTPHTMVALPASQASSPTSPHIFHKSKATPLPPTQKMCVQCNVKPRRYACPSTGVSLCSLECFRGHRAALPTVC